MAQLAEQLICNQQVEGSSPPIGFADQSDNNNAGWSSLEARRAHNPEVGGSNPPPATSKKSQCLCGFPQTHRLFSCPEKRSKMAIGVVTWGDFPNCYALIKMKKKHLPQASA